MIKSEIAHLQIVESDEWLTVGKTLLEHEKEYTKHRDSAAQARGSRSHQR